MDALSDVLQAIRLTGSIFFDIRATDPWVAETPEGRSVVAAMFPGSEHMMCYHVITQGSCWASVPGEQPLQLTAGDIIVLPHGDTHVLSSAPGLRKSPNMALYRRPDDGRLPSAIAMGDADGKQGAEFICGFLGCDAQPFNPLLAALPRIIRVSDRNTGVLATYVRFAISESRDSRIGGQSVLGRLSELMFVDAIRHYLETLPSNQLNWLAGLRDTYVGRALTSLHRQPAHEWTLDSLAKEVALSRSAFSERFTQYVGQPPMQYLMNWRMQLASTHLVSGSDSVAVIANRVGYESEAAFSRAFKKSVGVSPGEWRKQRQTPDGH
ncbi:MAG TPA: AraC family transcriptional regulator [Steroidobacteraceae bacterium]|nr:AraC family transcriptional regulator [Steroidobacteraceae bacterium]